MTDEYCFSKINRNIYKSMCVQVSELILPRYNHNMLCLYLNRVNSFIKASIFNSLSIMPDKASAAIWPAA